MFLNLKTGSQLKRKVFYIHDYFLIIEIFFSNYHLMEITVLDTLLDEHLLSFLHLHRRSSTIPLNQIVARQIIQILTVSALLKLQTSMSMIVLQLPCPLKQKQQIILQLRQRVIVGSVL